MLRHLFRSSTSLRLAHFWRIPGRKAHGGGQRRAVLVTVNSRCLKRPPRRVSWLPDVAPKRCIVCGRPAVSLDRCDTCYRFVRRNGFDRNPGRNIEANRRRLEREVEEAWLIHAQTSGLIEVT